MAESLQEKWSWLEKFLEDRREILKFGINLKKREIYRAVVRVVREDIYKEGELVYLTSDPNIDFSHLVQKTFGEFVIVKTIEITTYPNEVALLSMDWKEMK